MSAVAGAVPYHAAASGDDDHAIVDVDAARAGLHELVAGLDQVGELEPLSECPIADRTAVTDALETAGIDSPLATFDRIDGPSLGGRGWTASGVVCLGAYVGVERDESFPETQVALTVAELGGPGDVDRFLGDLQPGVAGSDAVPTPTIGGATVGACRHIDLHTQCDEYWIRDTFVIGVRIDDRVFVDRPSASAALAALIPDVVATLAAVPEYEEPAEFTATDAEVARARAGLITLAGADDPAQCPLVARDDLDAASESVGLELAVEDWSAGTEDRDGAAVVCRARGTASSVTLLVEDHGDSASAQSAIDLVHGCDGGFCVESWQQDGLLVTVAVTLGPRFDDRDAVVELLGQLLPTVLAALADAA
jgi:hypothetical protein